MSMMCGYMHGHYHIHLRVRELAVTPSPINHMALRDHLLLSLILREPNKAKSLRVTSLGFSFNLRPKKEKEKTKQTFSNEDGYHRLQFKTLVSVSYNVPEP